MEEIPADVTEEITWREAVLDELPKAPVARNLKCMNCLFLSSREISPVICLNAI